MYGAVSLFFDMFTPLAAYFGLKHVPKADYIFYVLLLAT